MTPEKPKLQMADVVAAAMDAQKIKAAKTIDKETNGFKTSTHEVIAKVLTNVSAGEVIRHGWRKEKNR